MSRIKNYVDRDTQERQAELHIIYDKSVSVSVFRYSTTASNAGISVEVSEQAYLRTINVRLDAIPSDGSTKKKSWDYLGMTDDLDVQENDRWEYTNPRGRKFKLRVKVVDTATGASQVWLKGE